MFRFYLTVLDFKTDFGTPNIKFDIGKYQVRFLAKTVSGESIVRSFTLFEGDKVIYQGLMGDEEKRFLDIEDAYILFQNDLMQVKVLPKDENRKALSHQEYVRLVKAMKNSITEIFPSGRCPQKIAYLENDTEDLKRGERPLGTKNVVLYKTMLLELNELLGRAGYEKREIFISGSAISFISLNPAKSDFTQEVRPTSLENIVNHYHYFDRNGIGTSDLDIHLVAPGLTKKMLKLGVTGPSDGRSAFVSEGNFIDGNYVDGFGHLKKGAGEILGFLKPFKERWSRKLGRVVEITIDTSIPNDRTLFIP